MHIKKIEIYINEYIEKLTMEIIDECILRKMKNTTDLVKVCKALLDPKDNSLLKKQIKFSNKPIIDKVIQDGNKFTVNMDEAFQKFTSSTFEQASILFEKNINMFNLSEENNNSFKKYSFNQEEAAELLTKNIDLIKALLLDELEKSNIEDLIYTFYSIAGILSIVSQITSVRTKFEIEEKMWKLDYDDEGISLLLHTVENLDKEEMKKVSYIVGKHKYACDMLFNIVYKLYLCDYDKNDGLHDSSDIFSLFSKVMALNRMELFRQSNALIYERGNFISVEDLLVCENGNLSDKLMQFMDEVISFDYNKKLINGVFDKYKKCEGFSPDNLSELNKDLMRISQLSDAKTITKIDTYPVEVFKDYIKLTCNIEKKGVDTFFSALCLEAKIDLFDMSNKISRTPLVVTKDNRVITTIPLLLQAEQTLGVRMLEQSFTNNPQVKKYINKHYNEDLIDDLMEVLMKKGIKAWKSLHLAAVKNKKITSLFVSKVTEEIDIAYFKDKILYFVEYKAWMIGSSNIKTFLSEYKKAENNVKSHYKAIEIVKSHIDEYTKVFGEDLRKVNDVKLIMVFQNPNAFNYLNQDKNVIGFSFQEFKKSIENH